MNKLYTVIGYWKDDDSPVSVGVIEGDHAVHAGHGATEGGDWATSVTADSHEEAEHLGVAEMLATGTADEPQAPDIGERAVWADPDGGEKSTGTVIKISGDIITLAIDDGGEIEALVEELSECNEGDEQ